MNESWRRLAWTPWVPLERQAIRETALPLPGVYRIRREGDASGCLVYVGQTGRTLRERLLALAAGVNAKVCPFNDPYTAAPHLWLLQQLYKVGFECACAPVMTANLRARALRHAATAWPAKESWLVFLPVPEGTPKHVLRELESDLLGWHFWRTGQAPLAQYGIQPDGLAAVAEQLAT